MDIAVLGATGTIGRLIVAHLTAAGHTARALSRATGVDAHSGLGLEQALEGADVVVDALNVATLSGRRAVSFFTQSAQNISTAAERCGVRRVVCLSIAGAADPTVHRIFGYYRGKAAQERTYREAGIPTTIIHSTQWFELASSMLAQASLGPVAVLPTMRMAPVAAVRVAALVVDEIEGEGEREGSRDRSVAIRGPKELTTAELVRRILDRRGELDGRSPRLVTELPYLGSAIAGGGLIPTEAVVDDMDLEDWLRATS